MDENSTFWTTEYSNITTQFSTLLGLYIKIFVIYVGVLGGALKFTFDKNSTPDLRLALCVFAIVVCCLFSISIYVATKFIKQLQERRKRALSRLEKQIESEFSLGYWAGLVMGIFNLAAFVGWIVILRGNV